jgi:hypothetical protein
LSNRITHLQECTRTPWMYTGENDTTSLECGSGTDMDTVEAEYRPVFH